jgi:hypothetical protein
MYRIFGMTYTDIGDDTEHTYYKLIDMIHMHILEAEQIMKG